MIHSLLSLVNKYLSKGKLHIFMYHQILSKFDPMRPNEPTTEQFEWQMALVKKYFTPLTLTDAVERLNSNSLPANAICITFDDGYLNNLTVAQPILAKYQIPATVYIATAFSEGENMWNDRILHLFSQYTCDEITLSADSKPSKLTDWDSRRNAAYDLLTQLKYLEPTARLKRVDEIYALNPKIKEQEKLMMTPRQLKQIDKAGFDIGAHTHSHPILSVLEVEEQRREILLSKQLLEQWLGKEVINFAYPNGIWQKDLDQQTVDVVEELGFKSAVITNWGLSSADTSRYLLPRFTPWDKTPFAFHTRLVRNSLLTRKNSTNASN
jgi:peptidoglycan/xylan/chitin deacetylase (PgdA/CDA1 family)